MHGLQVEMTDCVTCPELLSTSVNDLLGLPDIDLRFICLVVRADGGNSKPH